MTPSELKKNDTKTKCTPITPEAVKGLTKTIDLQHIERKQHEYRTTEKEPKKGAKMEETMEHPEMIMDEINLNFKKVEYSIKAVHNRITTVDDKLQQSLLQAQENIASLLKIKANQDKFENDIIDLNLEIGLTKENVREVKQDVEDVQSKLLKMDIEMTEVSDKQKRMQDVIDKQTITINGMGGSKLSTIMPNWKWSLADLIDADNFPLLKATMDKTAHYS